MKETLWTIQHARAYKMFERTGVLRANDEFLFCSDEFRFAYDWMTAQMIKRVGKAPEGVHYPVWAWYQWEGQRKRRDLRFGGYAERGTPMVQITFEAESEDFLLSDFDDWHSVLCGHCISDNEHEWDRFYANDGGNGKDEIIASWDKIFDLSRHISDWDCALERKSIQATLWEIRISQVIRVEHFVAK